MVIAFPVAERMSPVDAAWLRMDRPENPMTITAALRFEGEVDPRAFIAVVGQRLVPHVRFWQRVVASRPSLLGPRWEIDPHFDVRAHLHVMALPPPGGERALRDLVSDLLSTPLDRSRPLWQIHLVQGGERGSVAVVRVHHAVGDGAALLRVLLSVCDEGEGAAPWPPRSPGPEAHAGPGARLYEAAGELVTLGRILATPSDPPTAFSGSLGVLKRAAWSSPLPLPALKSLARAAAATVNDVLLSTVAGALGDYLRARGERTDVALRALVPVDLRGADGASDRGNRFGLVYATLPIDLEDPAERLAALKRNMDAAKRSSQALVALRLLGALGMASPAIERFGVDLFTRKATAMVTNVRGPGASLHVAGQRVAGLTVWAPVAGRLGLGVSLVSFAGEVTIGVASDALRVPEPERIAAAIDAQLDWLQRALARAPARGGPAPAKGGDGLDEPRA